MLLRDHNKRLGPHKSYPVFTGLARNSCQMWLPDVLLQAYKLLLEFAPSYLSDLIASYIHPHTLWVQDAGYLSISPEPKRKKAFFYFFCASCLWRTLPATIRGTNSISEWVTRHIKAMCLVTHSCIFKTALWESYNFCLLVSNKSMEVGIYYSSRTTWFLLACMRMWLQLVHISTLCLAVVEAGVHGDWDGIDIPAVDAIPMMTLMKLWPLWLSWYLLPFRDIHSSIHIVFVLCILFVSLYCQHFIFVCSLFATIACWMS